MHEEAETKYLRTGGAPKRLSKTSRDAAAATVKKKIGYR
jgi:hypothetical protein